eukprot:11529897-Alexandrium_andersonii.AAC.1
MSRTSAHVRHMLQASSSTSSCTHGGCSPADPQTPLHSPGASTPPVTMLVQGRPIQGASQSRWGVGGCGEMRPTM